MSLPPGAIAIDGWTVEGGEVAWIEIDNTYIKINPASNGNRILDLTGLLDATPFGAVRQPVSGLARGLTYELSLDLGTLQDRSGAFSGPIAVDVTVESGTHDHEPLHVESAKRLGSVVHSDS
jgi:hypothetical protein